MKVLVCILFLFPIFCEATMWETYTQPKLTPKLVDKYTPLDSRVTVVYVEKGETKVKYITVGCKTDIGFGEKCNALVSYEAVIELSKQQGKMKYAAKQTGKTVLAIVVLPVILLGTVFGIFEWH